MNSFLIILSIVAAIYALVMLMIARITYKKAARGTEKTHICIHNDYSGCYETPCKYCIGKNECQWVCEGDCEFCEGRRIKEEGIK